MEAPLSALVDMFIATKRTEGRSPKTLDWYRANLERFVRYHADGTALGAGSLTLDAARSFIGALQQIDTRYATHPSRPHESGGLSAFTIHGYVRTLKAFSRWLYDEGFSNRDTLARLRRPRLPKTVLEVLSDQEIEDIINSIDRNCSLGARLFLIVLLLMDTGIRASELCTLTVENVSLDSEYVKVVGKGDKERIVPFGATTKKAILRYLYTFRPEPAAETIHELILTTQGLPLSYSGLAQAIKRLAKRAGVPRLHVHLFRHTFAVRYLINGGDIMTLKRMLGHESLEVTQMYMHLAESHIQVQHRRFSPVDRLGITMRRRAQ